MSSKVILVTRLLDRNSLLRNWALENNFTLIEKAFIKFEKIDKVEIPKSDWIFFSSPNGVKIYLESHKITAKKIAALSTGTSAVLLEHGVAIDFVGEANQSTTEIAVAFKKQLNKNEKVLFPLSSISKKNISNQLGADQKIEIVLYQTLLVNHDIKENLAAIIFTSPSNVQGFLQSNKISESTQVIAIGETTKMEIEKYTNCVVEVADSYEEGSIISLLSRL